MGKYTLDYIKENDLILLEVIGGSIAYGTNTPTSDVDIRGVYICEQDDLYSGNYPEQINDKTNDIVFYELGTFLGLVYKQNPNILELLNTPEDCVRFKHPLFDLIIKERDNFVTKGCMDSFGGYARQQIKKAKGLNKKQNWEKDKVKRKDLLDFCYAIEGERSTPIKKWLEDGYYPTDVQKFCGVVNIPNARDMYALYYDGVASNCFSVDNEEKDREALKTFLKSNGKALGFGYKGLVKVGESSNDGISNQLRLSSIPEGEEPIVIFTYNKDGYSQHCKDYREYQEWLQNRNEQRYVDTQKHGQQIDGKNMMHCIRLIRMSKEIGEGKGIVVRRPDSEELLSIRRGEVDLESLIEMADNEIQSMDNIFKEANLPKKVDKELVHNLLIDVRKGFY